MLDTCLMDLPAAAAAAAYSHGCDYMQASHTVAPTQNGLDADSICAEPCYISICTGDCLSVLSGGIPEEMSPVCIFC